MRQCIRIDGPNTDGSTPLDKKIIADLDVVLPVAFRAAASLNPCQWLRSILGARFPSTPPNVLDRPWDQPSWAQAQGRRRLLLVGGIATLAGLPIGMGVHALIVVFAPAWHKAEAFDCVCRRPPS